MVIIRRLYVFLVCVVSLQATLWATIVLLRDLVGSRTQPIGATAFQIAVIVIGLPIWLAHWLWAQRLAARELDERAAALRRLYLYATLAACLAPIVYFAFDLGRALLKLLLGLPKQSWETAFTTTAVQDLLTLVILAAVWFYHRRVAFADDESESESESGATIRRLYIFGFSAAGLTILIVAIIQLLRWVLYGFAELTTEQVVTELARLVVGLPLWLLGWLHAQRLFTSTLIDERESVVRKVYLYAVVFVTLFATISSATVILAGLFRRLLALPSTGDIRDPLAVGIVTLALWAYHSYMLRSDVAEVAEAARQATIRRIYLYLVAAVSLGAFLIGLSGDLNVLIRTLTEASFDDSLREELAWFSAALIAGLLVWVWPWRQVQNAALDEGVAGAAERRSFVRKIYLYGYLFVATMTVLASAVYILFRLLSLALGERVSGSLVGDLAQAFAFIVIAVGVWLYHGYALRMDGRLAEREQIERRKTMRVVIVDVAEGRFGRALLEALRRELPGLRCEPIGLTTAAAQALGVSAEARASATQLAEAQLIVGPWQIAAAGSAGGAVTAEVAAAIAQSPARKLLVPSWGEGLTWIGAEQLTMEAAVRQTARAVKQALAGEEIKTSGGLGANLGTIILVIIGLCVLGQIISAVISLIGAAF